MAGRWYCLRRCVLAWVLVCSLVLISSPASAGFFSDIWKGAKDAVADVSEDLGAVVGGIVGGPVGAFVGDYLGGKISDELSDDDYGGYGVPSAGTAGTGDIVMQITKKDVVAVSEVDGDPDDEPTQAELEKGFEDFVVVSEYARRGGDGFVAAPARDTAGPVLRYRRSAGETYAEGLQSVVWASADGVDRSCVIETLPVGLYKAAGDRYVGGGDWLDNFRQYESDIFGNGFPACVSRYFNDAGDYFEDWNLDYAAGRDHCSFQAMAPAGQTCESEILTSGRNFRPADWGNAGFRPESIPGVNNSFQFLTQGNNRLYVMPVGSFTFSAGTYGDFTSSFAGTNGLIDHGSGSSDRSYNYFAARSGYGVNGLAYACDGISASSGCFQQGRSSDPSVSGEYLTMLQDPKYYACGLTVIDFNTFRYYGADSLSLIIDPYQNALGMDGVRLIVLPFLGMSRLSIFQGIPCFRIGMLWYLIVFLCMLLIRIRMFRLLSTFL